MIQKLRIVSIDIYNRMLIYSIPSSAV